MLTVKCLVPGGVISPLASETARLCRPVRGRLVSSRCFRTVSSSHQFTHFPTRHFFSLPKQLISDVIEETLMAPRPLFEDS